MTEEFIDLSASLTGFSRVDLLGTGVAGAYWNTVKEKAGKQLLQNLLTAWKAVQDSTDPIEVALRKEILSKTNLGPVARNIIKMWYLGQWADENIISAEAYQQGLVWDAIGAHTQGGKQQGFGVWSLPPKQLDEEVYS